MTSIASSALRALVAPVVTVALFASAPFAMVLDQNRIVVPLWGPLLQRLVFSTNLGSHRGPLSSSAPHRSRSELVKVPLA